MEIIKKVWDYLFEVRVVERYVFMDKPELVERVNVVEYEFDSCPICLGDDGEDLVMLPCRHKLHRGCCSELVKHGKNKCPKCRMDFSKDEVIGGDDMGCVCCREGLTKNDINYVSNELCGCRFHVGCLQKRLKDNMVNYPKRTALFILSCPFCRKTDMSANWCSKLNPGHYKYQEDAFKSWVSPLQKCSYNNIKGYCENYGNPARRGNFCGNHWHYGGKNVNKEAEGWERVEDVLKLVLRYYSHLGADDRFSIFQEILFEGK